MAIYLSLGKIKGDVTEGEHSGWISCDSLQWGVGRAVNTPTGATAKRESSPPSLSEVTVSKSMDKASPHLFLEAVAGDAKEVKIDLTKTGTGDKLDVYMTYTLTNAIVSGYSVSSGGDVPQESVSFNFTKLEMKYTPFDEDHKAKSPIPAAYDISKAKKG